MGLDPASLAVGSQVLGGVGSVMGAVGAKTSADATAAADRYGAQVALNNQQVANQYAKQAIEQGEQQEATKRTQTAETIGSQRAGMAAAGVELDNGTPLRLQGDAAKLGEQDALTIRSNAARAAYGYQVQGLSYAEQAQMDESAASNAESAGNLNAFTSIISGASSTAAKWATWKNNGVFA